MWSPVLVIAKCPDERSVDPSVFKQGDFTSRLDAAGSEGALVTY
jgi:hypothetical protein